MIDKELYKNAYLQYQQWNVAKNARRDHTSVQSESTPAWQKYIDLVEFCRSLNPQQSSKQRIQKLTALDQYYIKVQKLEEWRQAKEDCYEYTP